MKKLLLSSVALLIITACATKGSVVAQHETKIPSIQELRHNSYELVTLNGKTLELDKKSATPMITFGQNGRVTGTMCNNFVGQGRLTTRGILTVKGIELTRKSCADSLLQNLDADIVELLGSGAEIVMTEDFQYIRISNIKTALEYKLVR